MNFEVDCRIKESCVWIGDWALSSIYFKNEANFPWLILVPREQAIQEIYQLTEDNQRRLMSEITRLSQIMQTYFRPDKLNLAALGNLVPQLHIHLVARFKEDQAWPHGIWQAGLETKCYAPEALARQVHDLRKLCFA